MTNMTFPPGGTRYNVLPALLSVPPMDYVKVKNIRKQAQTEGHFWDWAKHNYTWNMFLREVSFISDAEAKALLNLLLMRDVGKDIELGLLGNKPASIEDWEYLPGVPFLDYMVGWQRIANRYAWYARACVEIPDPLHDPIPPMMVDPYAGRNVAKYFFPMARSLRNEVGSSSVVGLIGYTILYAFGYLPKKPDHYSESVWQRALTGLFTEPFPLTQWVMKPTDALNYVVLEYSNTGWAGFYPTPLNVCLLMDQVTSTCKETYEKVEPAPYRTIWEGIKDRDERIARLTERISDPCVGTGNMLWGTMNRYTAGQFIDVGFEKVLITRAMCAVFAPWFTNDVFRGNSLDNPVNLGMVEQQKQYREDEQASFLAYMTYCKELMAPDDVEETNLVVSEIHARGLARQSARFIKPLMALKKALRRSPVSQVSNAAEILPTLANIPIEFE